MRKPRLKKLRQEARKNARETALREGHCPSCAARAIGFLDPIEPGCTECSYTLGIYSGAEERARQVAIPFGVSPAQVAQLIASERNCRSCGVELALGTSHIVDATPVLHRVDDSVGFVPSNVALRCVACDRKVTGDEK